MSNRLATDLEIAFIGALLWGAHTARKAEVEAQQAWITEGETLVGIPPTPPPNPSIAGTVFRMTLLGAAIVGITWGLVLAFPHYG
jgi:hypothetical protein